MSGRRGPAALPPTVRPHAPADEAALLGVWDAALHADPIDAARFRARVLLDPNFQPAGCLVAEAGGAMRGFLLSLTRQVPFFAEGLQPEQAWITAFGVEPGWQGRGLGGALLDAALTRLRRLGRTTVTLGPYVPNFFAPGADVAAYGPGVDFLLRRGFAVVERPLDMAVTLTGWRTPDPIAAIAARLAGAGIAIRPVAAAEIVPLLDFVRRHFSWGWHGAARDGLAALFAGGPRQGGILVAARGDAILGYVQHAGESFGPLGVRPDARGQGIAKALTAAALREMRARGQHVAYLRWTFDEAARLYAQCGCREVRRYAMLAKELG